MTELLPSFITNCTEERKEEKISYANYFNFVRNENGKEGKCLLCEKEKKVKNIKMKNSNTSGLKKHLQIHHLTVYNKMFPSKQKPTPPKMQKTINTCFKECITNDVIDRATVTWLAYKNLPLNFFDDDVTQNFFRLLETKPLPKKNSMHDKVMDQFSKMKENFKELLRRNESKFSFTLDAWTARNSASYYGMTIHFIDNNWKLVSTTLDLVASKGRHTGRDIAEIFFTTLNDFNILQRVQGITVDNAAANATFIKEFGTMLHNKQIDFNCEDQHFRCFAHILNLGVQDILKLINIEAKEDFEDQYVINEYEVNDDESSESDINIDNKEIFFKLIIKIRNLFKKIKYSEILMNKLKSCCDASNIIFTKPVLDVKTRWNSTCDMIEAALKLKLALNMLCANHSSTNKFRLEESEWILIKSIADFLKHFKHVTNIISGEQYVVLPTAVIAFNILLDKIENIILEIDTKVDRSINDEKLLLAFQAGRDKMIKHYSKCNWVYCVSLILDPRHKVESFILTNWGRNLKVESVEKFKDIFKKKYFDIFSEEKECDYSSNNDTIINLEDSIDVSALYVKSYKVVKWDQEITQYLQSSRAVAETNVLHWWKDHSKDYPILYRMAKYFLSIMPTSVPIERVFSEGSLIVTKNRCSLKEKSITALLCINRWMRSSLRENICNINF